MHRQDGMGGCSVGPSRKHIHAVRDQTGEDRHSLLSCLAGREDHLRQADAKRAMVVDPRVPKVLEREVGETFRGDLGGDRSTFHFCKQFQ